MTQHIHHECFDSLRDLAMRVKASKDTIEARVSWAGGTRKQAIELALHGWPDGARRVKHDAEAYSITGLGESIVKTRADVSGSYVDVGAYVEGVPECMVEFEADQRQARFARIVFVGCYSEGASADAIFKRGAVIAALVDGLETQGVRCEVEAQVNVRGGARDAYHEHRVSVCIKSAHEPLNMDTLIYAAGHPTFWRQLVRVIQDEAPDAYVRPCGFKGNGHGGSGTAKSWDHVVAEASDIQFKGLTYTETWMRSAEASKAYVRELIERAMGAK